MHMCADNEKQRTLILSAIQEKSYSMMQITEVFGCTKHRVQSARKWRSNFGALNIGQQQQFTREVRYECSSNFFGILIELLTYYRMLPMEHPF